MKNLHFLSLIILALLVTACGSETASSDTRTENTETQNELPALPQETVQALSTQCDNIQYIFRDYPISFTQNEIPSIRQTLKFIQEETASLPDHCQPTAEMIFLGNGEILADALIYFLEDCSYIVFKENGQPTYSHKLSEAGKNFYEKILNNYYKSAQQQ